MSVICEILTNDGTPLGQEVPEPTIVLGALSLVMFWPDHYLYKQAAAGGAPEDLLPVDEVSVVFSGAAGDPTVFTICGRVIHKHDIPKCPTLQNCETPRGSTCTIQNVTIDDDKKFEIRITSTTDVDASKVDTWVFGGGCVEEAKLAMFQPKRLTIKVKRQSK